MGDAEQRDILRFLRPRAPIRIEWRFKNETVTHDWSGFAYEQRGGKLWTKPTEYRFKDDKNRLTIISSQLPRPYRYKGREVEIMAIHPLERSPSISGPQPSPEPHRTAIDTTLATHQQKPPTVVSHGPTISKHSKASPRRHIEWHHK